MEFFYQDEALFVGTKTDPISGPLTGSVAGSVAGSLASSQTPSIQLSEFVKKQQTPCYLYDFEQILRRVHFFKKSLFFIASQNIHFAVKANHNEKILNLLSREGLGADTVSLGEIKRAIASGFSAKNIIFSGVGKTTQDLQQAIDLNIKQINIESYSELLRIIKICGQKKQSIDIGIRLNPRVSPDTHKAIATGGADNKFGIDFSDLESVKKALKQNPEFVKLRGLSMHIGSNILKLAELEEAVLIIENYFNEFLKEGFELTRLDLGGGLGIDYHNYQLGKDEALIQQYADILVNLHNRNPKIELMLEPGRILVARSAILITQVQYIKKNGSTIFAVVDTGMNHLLRPALYDAHHQVWPLRLRNEVKKCYSVVGPICESTDVLAANVQLAISEDDYLAIADCGAYGMSMASHYNLHELPREYFFKDGQISNLA